MITNTNKDGTTHGKGNGWEVGCAHNIHRWKKSLPQKLQFCITINSQSVYDNITTDEQLLQTKMLLIVPASGPM